MLAGDGKGKPEVRRCIESLMTPHLTNLMATGDYATLLKLFTTNSETPLLIWDDMNRTELADFLERQRNTALKNAEDLDPSEWSGFEFSALRQELVVGGVFVRVFNDQPAFPLPDAVKFLSSLLDYLGNQAQYFASLPAPSDETDEKTLKMTERKLENTAMALESVRHVLTAKQEFCAHCTRHLKLLASFFVNKHSSKAVQVNTLLIFGVVAAVQEVVLAVAEQRILSSILLLEQVLELKHHLTLLQVLSALISHPEIVKQFIPMGGVLFVCDLFCNSPDPVVRSEAAGLLAKAISDRLSGPRVRIMMSKLLPPIFADAMAENAQSAVTLFEGTHENPELIWSEEIRSSTSLYISRTARDLASQQRLNKDYEWKAPQERAENSKEIEVGGIYIRLLIQNPGWQLRRPREFITVLFDKIVELTAPTNGDVDQDLLTSLAEAGCGLFYAQMNLTKMVPGMGIMPTLINRLSETKYLRSILLILNALAAESTCVSALAAVPNSLTAIHRCLEDDEIAPIAFETIYRASNHNNSDLTSQAVQNEGKFILALLKELGLNRVNKSGKAQIVKILKSMAKCLEHGETVQQYLDESDIWKSFGSQRHDLFIEDKPLLALQSNQGHSGYLTQGSSSVPDAPPPVS